MSSYDTIIIFIALFTTMQPTRSIHMESQKHSIRRESQSIKQDNGAPLIKQQPVDYSYQYRPFASAPDHIKQLVYQAYTPQEPYVNPHAFFYNINSPTPYQASSSEKFITPQHTSADVTPTHSPVAYRSAYKQPPPAQTIARINKIPNRSGIKYNNDDDPSHYGSKNRRDHASQQDQSKRSSEIILPTPKFINEEQRRQNAGHQMPKAIEQLLQYQAQIPYNVLANHIFFQAQKPFVPKPLPENVIERSGTYPNQVYYLNSNGEIFADENEFMSAIVHRGEL